MISVIIPSLYTSWDILSTVYALFDRCHTYSAQENKRSELKSTHFEVIIAHYGNIDDNLKESIEDMPGVVLLDCPEKGRAKQMNYAALRAHGEMLYFLHADTIVPQLRDKTIMLSIQSNAQAGSFRMRFDMEHWFLKLWSWGTRINMRCARFGDQSFFVSKILFDELGGYDESLIIEEDNDFARRSYCKTKWIIANDYVTTSADKYNRYGVFKTQLIFIIIHILYLFGCSQKTLLKYYAFFK